MASEVGKDDFVFIVEHPHSVSVVQHDEVDFSGDILQQALAEVTAEASVGTKVNISNSSIVIGNGENDDDLSFLLNIPNSAATAAANEAAILDQLRSIEPDKSVAASKENNFVTLYRGQDGSLQLAPDNNLIVGLDKMVAVTDIKQKQNNFISLATTTTAMPTLPRVVSNAAVGSSLNMVLVPTTNSEGIVTYVFRPATTTVLSPSATVYGGGRMPNVQMSSFVGAAAPRRTSSAITDIGGAHGGGGPLTINASQLTAMMRPVMTPFVTKSLPIQRQQRTNRQPILLPKLPSTVTMPTRAGNGRLPVVLPKVPPPKAKPLGSSENPIQLIQKGSSYHTMQPLSSVQLTQVANAIKKSNMENNKQDHQGGTEIVVEGDLNSKIVYKVMFPDDVVEEEGSNAVGGGGELALADDGDSSDDDSMSDFNMQMPEENEDNVENYYPHELWVQPPKKKLKKGELPAVLKKKGRPKRGNFTLESPEVLAEKLKKQFGLTKNQLQAVQKDLVDDRNAEKTEAAANIGVDVDDEEELLQQQRTSQQASKTRSGRVSRPPAAIDEDMSVLSRKTPSFSAVAARQPTGEPLLQSTDPFGRPAVEKIRKKMTVPDRYRCAICQKIYLGDRKMKRHMKLYPSHGPSAEALLRVEVSRPPPLPQLHSLAPPPPPPVTLGSGKKMPDFPMPIIPMARTQLEELVKNLDSELVMDVVSKKMFDNFSMWQLESKKISGMSPGVKGVGRLSKLLDDLEKMLGEVKRVVDNCVSDTKLCGENVKVSTLMIGENMQQALNMHEGPWYLEQTNHIPGEYHKILGIQPSIVSPCRSDSTNPPPTMLMHGSCDEDNSNSMLSLSSDTKEHLMSSSQGMGAHMVLERNLGAQPLDTDEDTQVRDLCKMLFFRIICHSFHQDYPPTSSSMGIRKGAKNSAKSDDEDVEDEEVEEEEEEDLIEEDGGNILRNIGTATESSTTTSASVLHHGHVDPKNVLEQNGIHINTSSTATDGETGIASAADAESNEKPSSSTNKSLNVASSQLAMEIDSLGPFPMEQPSTTAASGVTEGRTRLPSFSSIIGGSPKASSASTVNTPPVTTTDSGMLGHSHSVLAANTNTNQMQITMSTCDDLVIRSQSGQTLSSRRSSVNDHIHSGALMVSQSCPPSVAGCGEDVATTANLMQAAVDLVSSLSGPHSVISTMEGGPHSVTSVDQQHYAGSHISGPSSVASVIEHQLHHISGPPSVTSNGMEHVVSVTAGASNCHVEHLSRPPSTMEQHHGMDPYSNNHMSGPPSVISTMEGGPPSVASIHEHHVDVLQQQAGVALPGSMADLQSSHFSQSSGVQPSMSVPTASVISRSNPPSVHILHHSSNPASIDHLHQSIPNSPLSEVLSDAAVHSPMSIVGGDKQRRRSSVTNVTLATAANSDGLVVYGPAPQDPTPIHPQFLVGGGEEKQVEEQQHQDMPKKDGDVVDATHDSSSNHFLSDLDSMLNDSTDFPFTSALSSESSLSHMKTPEKLLRSIPPNSMMVSKAPLPLPPPLLPTALDSAVASSPFVDQNAPLITSALTDDNHSVGFQNGSGHEHHQQSGSAPSSGAEGEGASENLASLFEEITKEEEINKEKEEQTVREEGTQGGAGRQPQQQEEELTNLLNTLAQKPESVGGNT
jgi:hypothetical protein